MTTNDSQSPLQNIRFTFSSLVLVLCGLLP